MSRTNRKLHESQKRRMLERFARGEILAYYTDDDNAPHGFQWFATIAEFNAWHNGWMTCKDAHFGWIKRACIELHVVTNVPPARNTSCTPGEWLDWFGGDLEEALSSKPWFVK